MSGSVTLDGKQVNLGDFAFMVDWALNFCEAAKIDLAKKGKEALIEKKQQEIDRAQLKLQRFERMFADENEHAFRDFYGKVIQQLDLRKATFGAVQDLDQRQSERYQEKLHNFDKTYMAPLIAAHRGQ